MLKSFLMVAGSMIMLLFKIIYLFIFIIIIIFREGHNTLQQPLKIHPVWWMKQGRCNK